MSLLLGYPGSFLIKTKIGSMNLGKAYKTMVQSMFLNIFCKLIVSGVLCFMIVLLWSKKNIYLLKKKSNPKSLPCCCLQSLEAVLYATETTFTAITAMGT